MCWRKDNCERPFCPTRLPHDHKAINLIDGDGYFMCGVHHKTYLTKDQLRKEGARSAF
jgi:hypothetical protein